MANVIGRRTIKGRDVLNIDGDPTISGVSANVGSLALSPLGTYTKIGALNTEWAGYITAPLFGVARYVYLVNDASDQARLGGVANDVFTTAQEAYDYADILQTLLGGSNKVIIKVGVTTAGSVGGFALTATYNSNIEWVGEGSTLSVLDVIVSGTYAMSVKFTNMGTSTISSSTGTLNVTATNSALASVFSTGGASVTISLRNSTMASINTSNLTGGSGAIIVTGSNNSTIGAIVSSSSLGHVGALTFTSCNTISVASVSMTQTSTIASFDIGALTMNTSNGIRINGTTTITMAYQLSTGNIGGLVINSSNQNILFTGNVRITGYANNTNLSSDVKINSIYCVNCTFGGFFINHRTTGFNAWEGGTVTTLNFHKCFFRTRVRIAYNNTTEVIAGVTFRMTDCQVIGSNDGVGLDFTVLTKDISFDAFIMQGIESNFSGTAGAEGLAVANDVITVPLVPFTIDGVSALFSNINGHSLVVELYNPATANSTYDAVVLGCSVKHIALQITEGDINFKAVDSSATNNYYLLTTSATAPIKRTEITGCNFVTDQLDMNFYGQVPVTLRNSYIGYYTNILNPLTQDVIAYNSFVESYAEATSVTTWNGTLNTSTLRRLVTDVIVGATFNNSYDESY